MTDVKDVPARDFVTRLDAEATASLLGARLNLHAGLRVPSPANVPERLEDRAVTQQVAP